MFSRVLALLAVLLLSANTWAAIEINNHQARNMDDVQSLGEILGFILEKIEEAIKELLIGWIENLIFELEWKHPVLKLVHRILQI